ncbi:MAG TPA: hypothetical protein VGI61_11025, partial [Parafilimonas sp.]
VVEITLKNDKEKKETQEPAPPPPPAPPVKAVSVGSPLIDTLTTLRPNVSAVKPHPKTHLVKPVVKTDTLVTTSPKVPSAN